MSGYAGLADFETYLESYGTEYYGNKDNPAGTLVIDTAKFNSDVDASFARINAKLNSIGRIPLIPIGTQKNGSYNAYLIEWNVTDTIYVKMKSRHSSEFKNNLPGWMEEFGSRAKQIHMDIINSKITLETDTIARGIGYPVKIGTPAGVATFNTNWDSGYYSANDYPKIFRIKISGTTDGNDLGKSTFQVSEDDGVSYLTPEYLTGTTWIDIQNGLKVRWQPASLTGTLKQTEYGDTHQITCIPPNVRSTGYDSQFKRFDRG